MDDWRKIAREATSKPADEREGLNRPTEAVVESVSTETETIQASDFGGGGKCIVTHPFMGVRSWIRALPERGASVVLSRRGDSAVSETAYYRSLDPARRVAKYRAGVGYYRAIDQGEFDMSSYGLAQVYGSRGGSLDLRGGITRGWFNNESLEVGFKAPLHVRQLHDHRYASLAGEERFGAVWRPTGLQNDTRGWQEIDGSFAREYTRVLSFQGIPGVLVDYREGHVFEDDGSRANTPSAQPARRRAIYYDSQGDNNLELMDESGNTWEFLSSNAKLGKQIDIPEGSHRIKVGVNIAMQADKDITATGQNLIVRTRNIIHLESEVAIKLVSKGMITLSAAIVEINKRVINSTPSPF